MKNQILFWENFVDSEFQDSGLLLLTKTRSFYNHHFFPTSIILYTLYWVQESIISLEMHITVPSFSLTSNQQGQSEKLKKNK